MQWRRFSRKKSGDIRKRFDQWGIPKDIREKLGIKDGIKCTVGFQIGTYSQAPTERVVTSGGEFRLPKDVADKLRLSATADPDAEIVFTICRAPMSHPVPINRARKKAISDGAFDPTDDMDARERVAALIARRQGQPAFRRKLLNAYGNRCAISGCDCADALEAAHIRPYRGKHTNHIKNGILLRGDLHTLFDLGKIRIDPDYRVRVCDELQSTVYKEYSGKRLTLPKHENDWPDCSS